MFTRPKFVKPCAPILAKRPPVGDSWTYELKWDGYRFLIIKDAREVRLYSKSGAE